jgi:plasmid stabilization system protein ParE
MHDLDEIAAYIAVDSLRAALVVEERIRKASELLITFPRGGRIGRVPGTRERVVSKTPYILAYRIEVTQVYVLRVYHSARKWPKSF